MGDAPHTIVASNAEDWADNSEWAVPSRAFYVDASNATWTNLVQRGEFAGIKVIGTSSRRTLKPVQTRIRVEDYAPYSTWWNESNGNASASGSASVNGITWRVYGEDAEFFRDLYVTTDISCWLAKPRAVMPVMEVPAYIYTKTEHSGDCVAALKSQAFEFAGELEKVTIPASMDEIGPWAFNGCTNLKEIVWYRDPKHMQCGSRSFSDVPCVDFGWAIQGSRLVGYWGVCPSNLQIPTNVTEIGVNKFNGTELAFECSQTLVSLTIPSSVTNIEEWAMTDCPNLKAVVLPEGMTHLPEGLFDQDMKLANVILPASITSVGEMSLSEIAGPVVFQGDKPSVSGSPFASSDSYKVYFLPGTKGWEDGGTWYGMRTYAISQEELAQIKRDRSADMRATLDGGRATEFTIQFNANGGTGTMRSVVVRYDNEGAMPKNAFSKNGAHFIGWSETPDGPAVYRDGASLKSLAIDADGVARLYAKWASNAYTISFDANGGEGEMQPVDCQLNQALSLPSNLFTNLGCTFVGWALSDDRQKVVYSNRQSVSNLIALSGLGETLYAVWQTNRYNVVFNANKGSGTMRDQDFAYGETKALSSNDFVRVGHDYLGWSLTPDGVVDYRDGEIVSNLTAVANQTVTLYAKWHSHTYRVVFDANGGTGTMPDSTFNCGTIYQLPKNTFIFGGLVFIGWSLEPEGPVVYRNGSEVVDLAVDDGAEVTLYAVWSDTYPWAAEADGPFDPLVANVYDGYLVDEAQAVVGTIQVKTAKQAVKTVSDKVTKVKSVVTNVAVTATVTDPAAKKWRYSKGAVAMPVVDGLASVTGLVCTAKGVVVTNFTVSVGLNGMSGAWGDYEIVGARNGMGVKGDPMMTALDGYKRSWSATVGGTRLQLTPRAKGTTKIVGTTPDGFKISANVQGVMGDGAFYVPYVATLKNGRLTKSVDLLLRVLADGTVEVLSSSLGELVEGGATEAPVIADRTARRTILAGVTYSETVAIQELGHPAKFAATKLPTGLKINATTGEITGVPTKAGTYESVIKATSGANSKWIDQITRTYVVEALPPWAVGTFDGGSHEGVGTVTVAATGKISGKWMSEGTNWTLTATSFDAYDPEEDAYWATVVGKSGKLAFTNDLVVTSEVLRTDLFKAYQNNWKVEPLKSEAVNLKGRIFTREVAGGELTLKVGANGTVTITGRFVTGVDARGKEIVYTATGSGVLIPTDSGDYFVHIYLPPKSGKFDGLATEVFVTFGD